MPAPQPAAEKKPPASATEAPKTAAGAKDKAGAPGAAKALDAKGAAQAPPKAAGGAAKPAGDQPGTAQELTAGRGPGQPLDAGTRAWFEHRLGRHLGEVRIHTDELAAAAARQFSARAFTFGHHVVFGQGEYQPHDDG